VITVAAYLWLALVHQSVSADGAEHMQAGVEAHKQGKFDVAIAEFRQATESDPLLVDAFLDLGEVCLENRDYGCAVPALKRALELNADLDAAHLQLGFALLAEGYPDQAIPHLERVHSVEALGVAYIETGRYEDAIASLRVALEKRPGDPDLLYYLGRAAGLLSKRSIDLLISGYPDSARAHQAMGEKSSVRIFRGCIWNWGKSTPIPHNGRKRKRSFAPRRNCSLGMLK
jgi:tetratricopeptide (TPR) repeat protein